MSDFRKHITNGYVAVLRLSAIPSATPPTIEVTPGNPDIGKAGFTPPTVAIASSLNNIVWTVGTPVTLTRAQIGTLTIPTPYGAPMFVRLTVTGNDVFIRIADTTGMEVALEALDIPRLTGITAVKQPGGGSTLSVGDVLRISWTVVDSTIALEDVDSVRLTMVKAADLTYAALISAAEATSPKDYTIPVGTVVGNYYVLLESSCVNGRVVSHLSPLFTIA